MRFRVLDARTDTGSRDWMAVWNAWSGREVMAHPEYVRLFARPEDRVVCAVGEGDGDAILFPLLLRPLSAEPWADARESRWDATTPYGYGGPFATGRAIDGPAFWRAYLSWVRDEQVVSTFARLSLFPEDLAPLPWPTEVRLENVVVPLERGEPGVWGGYETKVRKWIRRAETSGIQVEIDRDGSRLDAFLDVYRHTMERRGADAWYFFPRTFFEGIVRRLAGHFAFVHALAEGRVVSSDLVLCSAERVYYFLGGTLESAFPLGPNYLVKHGVASWALHEGKRQYVLGGGYEPRDGLYRYKRAFSRGGRVPFSIATAVHDERGYGELASARDESERRAGRRWAPRSGYFPIYRA